MESILKCKKVNIGDKTTLVQSLDAKSIEIFDELGGYIETISKPQVQQLINELQSIHDQMVD